jgi:hypothetical protein
MIAKLLPNQCRFMEALAEAAAMSDIWQHNCHFSCLDPVSVQTGPALGPPSLPALEFCFKMASKVWTDYEEPNF